MSNMVYVVLELSVLAPTEKPLGGMVSVPPMNPSDAPEVGYMGFDMLSVTLMGAGVVVFILNLWQYICF